MARMHAGHEPIVRTWSEPPDGTPDWCDACWIAAPPQPAPAGTRLGIETAWFRLRMPCGGAGTLRIRISANTRFKLFLNGKPIAAGPRKGDAARHFYSLLETDGPFLDGENDLRIQVVSFPPREAWGEGNIGPSWAVGNAAGPCLLVAGAWYPVGAAQPAPVGVTQPASVGAAQPAPVGVAQPASAEDAFDVTTGRAAWETMADDAITWKLFPQSFWHGALEVSDGARAAAIRASGDGENGWKPALVRWPVAPSPYGVVPVFPLVPDPLPPMRDEPGSFHRILPARADDLPQMAFMEGVAVVPARSRMQVELDAKVLRTAWPQLEMHGGAGSRIVIRYAEGYARTGADGRPEKGIRDDWTCGELAGHEDVCLPAGGLDVYEPFWFRVFRFVRIEVETADEPLTLRMPVFRETGYPLAVGSAITSSADWVALTFEINVRTLQRCMQETHVDCPYYEQMQYTLDTRLQILFTHVLGSDVRLARLAMEDYHASLMPEGMIQSRCPSGDPQVIPPFAPAWIQMLEDHWLQTGDTGEFRRYRATVDAVLDWFERYRPGDGLVGPTPYWQIVDATPQWNHVHGTPEALLHGPSALINLMVVLGLQSAARMSRMTGRPAIAREYAGRARGIRRELEKTCWCPERGMYREGPDFAQFSQQTQALAVLAGLATGNRARRILERALDDPDVIACGYPLQFHLFRALEQAGLYPARAGALLAPWRRLLDQHLTTTPEFPEHTRSDCHAWSASPIHELIRCVLGVRPGAPGWTHIRLEPHPLDLPDASGTVWTPHGTMRVSWKRDGARFQLEGEAPAGIRVAMRMPDGTDRELPAGGTFLFESSIDMSGCA